MTERPPMLAAERRREIVRVVRSQGRIEVTAAATRFDTPGETMFAQSSLVKYADLDGGPPVRGALTPSRVG